MSHIWMSRVLPPVRLRAGRRGLVLTRVPTNNVPASANIPRTHTKHTHTHTRTHTHTYAHTHTHTHAHTAVLIHWVTPKRLSSWAVYARRLHGYIYMCRLSIWGYIIYIPQKCHGCLYMYVYIYMCVYVCECVGVCGCGCMYMTLCVCVCQLHNKLEVPIISHSHGQTNTFIPASSSKPWVAPTPGTYPVMHSIRISRCVRVIKRDLTAHCILQSLNTVGNTQHNYNFAMGWNLE